MDGYVDPCQHGTTELRVHGVSGTAPQDMLGSPHVQRVAGDDAAGFYRRLWLHGPPDPSGDHADGGGRRREAYSWGGLTSGTSRQAMWLLLLPFALTNVAFHMWPGDLTSSDRLSRFLYGVATALQRLFALSLTATFVLTVIVVADDVVGWQCASPALSEVCVTPHGYLHFLGADALAEPGRRLAVTSLAPVGMVALLWALGRATWNAHERRVPSPTRGAPSALPLAQPSMWNGSQTVRRLRAVHVSLGLALCGLFLLAPLHAGSPVGSELRRSVLAALLGYAAVCPVVLLLPWLWRRAEPQDEKSTLGRTDDVSDAWRALPWIGMGLLGLAVWSAATTETSTGRLGASLPYLADSLVAAFAVQAAVFVLLLVVTACSAWRSRRGSESGSLPGRALGGIGLPVVLLLAWVVAGALSAGVVIRVTDYLGTPVPHGRSSEAQVPLHLSPGYSWAAAATISLVVALLIAGGLVAGRTWRHARLAEDSQVRTAYAHAARAARQDPPPLTDAEIEQRLSQISRTWAVARLTEHAPLLLGVLAMVLGVSLVAGSTAYWFADRWVLGSRTHGLVLSDRAPWLVTAGSWAIGLLVLALLGLARSAYRSPGVRRTVGIIWDLGTFWPRAAHPLAPPCYMERALPDLCSRIEWLTKDPDDLVVLSTHSQGTVMAAAVVLQVDSAQREQLALLTYGSPLQRLYQRFFPAYFGPEALQEVQAQLRRRPGGAVCEPRWRNLYRLSDPIGGPVLSSCGPNPEWYDTATDSAGRQERVLKAGVDLNLLDPLFPRRPGDPAYPSALRHSDYAQDPYFAAAVEVVIALGRAQGAVGPGGAAPKNDPLPQGPPVRP